MAFSPLDYPAICALGCEQLHYVVSSPAPFFPLLIVQEVLSNRDLSKCLPLTFSGVPVTPVVLEHVHKYLADFFKVGKIGTINPIFSIS